MKLKFSCEAVEIDDEIICVPVGEKAVNTNGVLKVNQTGYEIIKLLENDTTPEKITDELTAKYDETDRQTIYDYVCRTIDMLRDYSLIE